MTKKLVCIAIFSLLSCQGEISGSEINLNSDTLPTDAAKILIQTPKQGKLLLKASCTEPFMSVEIFTNKAVFTFPEKDTLVLIHHFDAMAFKKDFRLFTIQNKDNFTFLFVNKPCTHPGSGEKWPIKAKFEINKVRYQGCAKAL